MVSGHTITKPTINLSRVNMQNISNTSRLSDIQEVSTPNRNQDINEVRSPIAVSIPITQLRRYVCILICRNVCFARIIELYELQEEIENFFFINNKNYFRKMDVHADCQKDWRFLRLELTV